MICHGWIGGFSAKHYLNGDMIYGCESESSPRVNQPHFRFKTNTSTYRIRLIFWAYQYHMCPNFCWNHPLLPSLWTTEDRITSDSEDFCVPGLLSDGSESGTSIEGPQTDARIATQHNSPLERCLHLFPTFFASFNIISPIKPIRSNR